MDFMLTQEQQEYQSEFLRFGKKINTWTDGDKQFSREIWGKIADFGLFGLTADEAYGGLGENCVTAAAVYEALGYAAYDNGLLFAITNHVWVAQNLIDKYGSKTLKDKYLKRMISGELIGAFALTEVESGSDAFNMRTKAEEDGDEYVITGSKMFISNGSIADVFVVCARTTEKNFTTFIVEKGFEGFTVGKSIEKMGLESCPMSEIVMDRCRVPKENVLGHLHMGINIASAALEWERCFEAAPCVGTMKRIMERCIEHVNTREQSCGLLNQFQGITHKISDMHVGIEMSRLMLYKYAFLKDSGKNAFLDASVFKLYLSERYIQTCRDAMQIFGAYGYTTEYGLEREMRDALASSIYSGTSEIQRNTIFRLISEFA